LENYLSILLTICRNGPSIINTRSNITYWVLYFCKTNFKDYYIFKINILLTENLFVWILSNWVHQKIQQNIKQIIYSNKGLTHSATHLVSRIWKKCQSLLFKNFENQNSNNVIIKWKIKGEHVCLYRRMCNGNNNYIFIHFYLFYW